MLLGRFFRIERAEVTALAGLRIRLAGIKTILTRFQFPNHDSCLRWSQSKASRIPRLERLSAADGPG